MIRRMIFSMLTALFVCSVTVLPAFACTNLTLQTSKGDVIRARTMELGGDMESEVLVLPKGTDLVGYGPEGKPNGLKWTAKYTAVGLNGFHVDVMLDGVNEQGLSGGALMFPTFAGFQQPDPAQLDRTFIAPQLLTWALTQYATVDEVKAALPDVHVINIAIPPAPEFPLHFIFTDRTKASLIVEYENGELHTYDDPIGVMTNSPPFPWHVTNLRNYINLSINSVPSVNLDGIDLAPIGTGGSLVGMPGDFTPPARFIRATILSQAAPKLDTTDAMVLEAFHIMNQFDIPPGVVPPNANTPTTAQSEPEHTQWTVVYDLSTPRLYVSTMENRGVSMVDLTKIDPAAGILHLQIAPETEITELTK
jgi:choloylglycine hydrolase